jgi:hypothetical protein
LPTKLAERSQGKVPKLLKALAKDLSGVVDSEGRSELDFLIIDLQDMPASRRSEWTEAVARIIRTKSLSDSFSWKAIERLVVLGGLQSSAVGVALEEALAARIVTDSRARAIAYSILDLCGMAPSAATIGADKQLRIENRLLWLDLMISRVPRLEDAQQIILDAVSDRQFNTENFWQRISEMRNIGGQRLGDWIRMFRAKIDPSEWDSFDSLVDEAFGPLAIAAGTQTIRTQTVSALSDPDMRSVRTLALMDPKGASLPVGLAVRRWQPDLQSRRMSGETKAVMGFLEKAVAFNRDAQLQYSYLTARKHKALRVAFEAKPKNRNRVESSFVEFLEFLNKRFYEVMTRNFELLHVYFSTRAGLPPRMSLKGTFRIDASETVVSIFRDHEADYQEYSDTAIEKNTGFHHIKETGSYFLENNIPKAALEGRYVNPRLNTSLIRAEFGGRDNENELVAQWSKYWTGGNEQKKDDPSSYASTLIVPLTLLAEDIV